MLFQILPELFFLEIINLDYTHQSKYSQRQISPKVEGIKLMKQVNGYHFNYYIQYSFYFPVGVHFDY